LRILEIALENPEEKEHRSMAYREIFDEAVRLRKSGAGRRPGRELTLEDKARLYPVRDSKSGKRDLYYWHPGRNEFRHHVAICTALERSVISNVAGIKPSAEALAAIGSPQSLADLEVGPSPETPEPAPKRAAAPSSSAAGAATAQQQDKRPRTQDAGGPSSSNPQVLQAQGVGPPSREKERSVAEELHAAKLKEKQLQRELDAEKRAHAATALDVWRPPTAPIAPTAAAPVASDGIADAEQDAAEPHQGSTQPDAVQAELLKPTRFAIICIEAPGQRDTKVYVPLSSAHTFGRLDKAVGGAACIGRLRKWQPIKLWGSTEGAGDFSEIHVGLSVSDDGLINISNWSVSCATHHISELVVQNVSCPEQVLAPIEKPKRLDGEKYSDYYRRAYLEPIARNKVPGVVIKAGGTIMARRFSGEPFSFKLTIEGTVSQAIHSRLRVYVDEAAHNPKRQELVSALGTRAAGTGRDLFATLVDVADRVQGNYHPQILGSSRASPTMVRSPPRPSTSSAAAGAATGAATSVATPCWLV